MGKASTFVIGALAGACVGACAALLLAPRSGVDTRSILARKSGSFASDIEAFANDVPGNVKKAVQNARGKVAGEQASSDEASEELRAKIEEARQRIAAQIEENKAAAEATA